jgi:ribonuclease Z
MNTTLWFLGTGGAEPGAHRANTSLLLRDNRGGALLLVDCSGSPNNAIYRTGNAPESLHDVFLTHAHTDHIYGLPSLIHGLWLCSQVDKSIPLRIHGLPDVLDAARALVGVLGLESKLDPLRIDWRPIEGDNGTPFLAFGDVRAFAFPVTHAGVPTLGLELRSPSEYSVVYSADAHADACVRARLSAATRLLIHDSGGGLNKNNGHAGAADIAGMVDGTGVESVYLVHIPPVSQTDLSAMTAAFDGNTVRTVVIPNDGDILVLPI